MQTLTGLPPIPAMTSDAEREMYYRLAGEAAGNGAIVEFGAWLGASTAYIAAGIRDSGAQAKVEVYDKFDSKPGHVAKVRRFFARQGMRAEELPLGNAFPRFKRNLGPLMAFVDARQCQIEKVKWDAGPIALVVSDAPKRVPCMSAVLTNFRSGLVPGTVMAWQDFCHFPSYEIPACLYHLRDCLEFVETATPGTTIVFRIKQQWEPERVTREALALRHWTPAAVAEAWAYWLDAAVPAAMRALFRCGEALFLCDIGEAGLAHNALAAALALDDGRAVAKLDYIRQTRPDLTIRYRVLLDMVSTRKAA